MAARKKPLGELAAFEAKAPVLDGWVELEPGAPPVPAPLSPEGAVRNAYAALADAITAARKAGYIVAGDLDRIAISATSKAA